MITFRAQALLLWEAKVCGEQPGLAATVSRDPGVVEGSSLPVTKLTYKIETFFQGDLFKGVRKS